MTVWFVGPERASNAWRCTWPAAALRGAGHDARAFATDAEREARIAPGDTVIVHHTNQGDTFAPGFRRLAPFLEVIRREVDPALLAVQYDDSYHDLGDIQDTEGRGWFRALLEDVEASCRAADRVIVTTPHIASRLEGYGTEVVVVPNYIAAWVTELELPDRLGEKCVWLGTLGGVGDAERGLRNSAHQHDWEWALSASMIPDVPIRVVGVRSYREHRWFFDRLGSRYDHRRATFDLERLYRMVAEGCVGLAPVDPALGFNRAKSWIKPLEYTALGLPCVAAPTPEYLSPDLHPALEIVKEPDEFWSSAAWTHTVVTGRHRLRSLRQKVRERYSVEANVTEWEKALSL